MQKLGKNHGGYHGETIDIRAVLRDIKAAAQQHGWTSELFYETGDLELFALHRGPKPEVRIQNPEFIFQRAFMATNRPGPLAALRLIQENHWPANEEIFLLPCLNPDGFILNPRGERRWH